MYHVASSDSTVLLLGESGVGKEVMAKILHENSYRVETGTFMKSIFSLHRVNGMRIRSVVSHRRVDTATGCKDSFSTFPTTGSNGYPYNLRH
ncbi:sigma 54-interacting transcriptional regulator [Ammoniphilus sp. YIM 78166]|uniref:sigma 54-interacting transcriptional regulator n=1 Tax=Ammoniphilus sp. YIM 78166 TaxID=1644106 RepID=UPI00272CA2D5|nr:sigma 54-interacting transcriptional regulator [Ammoniphilus sp. YIM 78166]